MRRDARDTSTPFVPNTTPRCIRLKFYGATNGHEWESRPYVRGRRSGDYGRRRIEIGRAETIDCLPHRRANMEHFPGSRPDEPLLDAMIDHGQKRVVKAGDVEQDDRLCMKAQEAADEDFEDFLERAQPAGQCDEGVGFLLHQRLALAHALRHE